MSGENHLKVQDGFQEKYLWDDPLLSINRFKDKIGPVLIADEIREYIYKYHLLIADPSDFDEEHLKGASYSMKPDPKGKAWQFDEKGFRTHLKKKKETGKNGEDLYYYEVPPNTLVYIRLLEKLRLPYYIIARFNLKVTYTYKGLLLGTGPQVDPGYEANLNIPLHNLTKDPVNIYIDDSFVSIDFVRTSRLDLGDNIPKSRNEFLDDEKYEELRKQLRPQDSRKLGRKEIEDYVGDSRPTSSLGNLVKILEKSKKTFESVLDKVKYDFIGTAILVVAMLALMSGAFFYLNKRMDTKLEAIRNVTLRITSTPEIMTDLKQTKEQVAELMKIFSQNSADQNILRSKAEQAIEEVKENIVKTRKEQDNIYLEMKKNQENLNQKIEALERKEKNSAQRSK
jgi:deoxycytidine triphosphate deaminase